MTRTTTMHGENLQGLTQIINHATYALAASRMLNQDILQAFAWAFETQASHIHAQHFPLDDDDDDNDEEGGYNGANLEEEEAVDIAPLFVPDMPVQVHNPMIFAMPFVVVEEEVVVAFVSHKNTKVEENIGEAFSKDAFLALSAVATFNLGLAKHTLSYHQNDSGASREERQQLLRQAKDLYQQAFELLDNHVSFLDTDGTLMHLYLALCNNLAEVCGELADLDHDDDNDKEARAWQATLQECLKPVRPSGSRAHCHLHNAALAYSITF